MIRVYKTLGFLAAVSAAVLWGGVAGNSHAWADDTPAADTDKADAGKGDADKTDTDKPAKTPAKGARDPVAMAFALPKGAILTPKQQAAYDDFKAAKEDELRQAFDAVQKAPAGASTAQSLKKVKELRDQIRARLQQILASPNGEGTASSGSEGSGSGSSYPGGYTPGYSGYGPGYGGYYPPYGGYNPYYRPYGPYPNGYRPPSSKSTGGGGSTGKSTGSSTSKPGGSTTPPKPAPKPAPKTR
jgi:hypothetical protein